MILPSRRIYFNKMIKTPKFKGFQMASLKDKKGYMKDLQEELNKSRMAVETITTFKNNQMNFKKKIDQIQQQLHSCLSRINTQTKKNVALTELISLLKGQMFQFQKKQKQEQELSVSQSQKRIKKIQYDIQQILQKHNQQIAKINLLKEQANCVRSQRVVFSNLFKKLEKELKQNQESYNQNLMKSQVAKDKVSIPPTNYKFSNSSIGEDDQQYYRPTLTKKSLFLIQNQTVNQQQQTFVTLQRHPSQTTDLKEKRKKMSQKLVTQDGELDIKMTSNGFNQMITSYQTFLQGLKVAIGYSDSRQITDHYGKLEQKNQLLSDQVQAFNSEIINLSHMTQYIYKQKKSSQCYQYSKDLPLGSTRRIKMPTQSSSTQQPQDVDQIMTLLSNLSLALRGSTPKEGQFNEQQLKELDFKLDQIILQCKGQGGKQQNHRSRTQISQINVDSLLQRMQKFNQCEKLLDLPSFKQQYTKQIGKCKKSKNKK